MQLPRLSPSAFRRVTFVAVLALAFIVVTGGAVRLTGSGLGCPDWPTCAEDRLVAPWEYHAMVEFVNRTITGLVSVAVMVAVLGSLLRTPRRRDLVWLSLGLVGGVLAQIVLGGLTVLFDLAPPLVMAHFLVSMVLLADAVILHHRAGWRDDPEDAGPDSAGGPSGPSERGIRGPTGPVPTRPVVPRELMLMGRLVLVAAAFAILLGTVVTGSGPHGGDEEVERLPLLVSDVARVHGASVVLLLVLTVVTLWRLQRASAPASLMRRGEVLLAALVAQAAVGYAQYLTGVPALMVGVHIAGAVAVWIAALSFLLGFSSPRPAGTKGVGVAADPGPELVRSE